MASNSTDNINSDALILLRDVLKGENLSEYSIEIAPGSNKGDGFLSVITKVSLIGRNKSFHFIIKCCLANPEIRKLVQVNRIFCREIYFYDRVYPTFEKFQADRNVGRPFNCVPKCYKTCKQEGDEKLVLQNLHAYGYKPYWKTGLLDVEHVCLILTQLAKFHAISFAMQDQDMAAYNALIENMDDLFNFNEKFIYEVIANVERVQDLYKEASEIHKTLAHFKDGLIDFTCSLERERHKYNAISHGDPWCNNMMFKYKDFVPIDIRIFDFQLLRAASPVLDLSFLLYSCTTKDIYGNLDRYLEFYYQQFSWHMEALGSKAEKMYPFHALKDDWKKYSRFGYFMSLIVLKMFFTESDEVVDIADMVESGEKMSKVFTKNIRNEKNVTQLLMDVTDHVFQNGFIS